MLGILGLFIGGGATGSFLVNDLQLQESVPEQTAADTTPVEPSNEVLVDVNDPDFSRIYRLYHEGETQKVISVLKKLYRDSNSRSVRARALYQQYVFYQNQRQYDRALKTADQFLSTFTNHPYRPEILYGAGIICTEYANNQCSKNYHDKLKQKHPKSKWVNELPSSS